VLVNTRGVGKVVVPKIELVRIGSGTLNIVVGSQYYGVLKPFIQAGGIWVAQNVGLLQKTAEGTTASIIPIELAPDTVPDILQYVSNYNYLDAVNVFVSVTSPHVLKFALDKLISKIVEQKEVDVRVLDLLTYNMGIHSTAIAERIRERLEALDVPADISTDRSATDKLRIVALAGARLLTYNHYEDEPIIAQRLRLGRKLRLLFVGRHERLISYVEEYKRITTPEEKEEVLRRASSDGIIPQQVADIAENVEVVKVMPDSPCRDKGVQTVEKFAEEVRRTSADGVYLMGLPTDCTSLYRLYGLRTYFPVNLIHKNPPKVNWKYYVKLPFGYLVYGGIREVRWVERGPTYWYKPYQELERLKNEVAGGATQWQL
jgi:hypothetical protein